MRYRNGLCWLRGCSAAMGIMLFAPVSPAANTTLAAEMRAVWSGEMSDAAAYEAYARRADAEKLGNIASLFRSIARSEIIHAQAEADMMRRLGGTLPPNPQAPAVATTEKNLAAALEREEFQRHRVYPALAHRARQQRSGGTVRTLLRIQGAEDQHIVLLNQVRSSLGQTGPSEHRYFYVCSGCGYTTEEITFDMCPNCFGAAEQFEMIS